MFRVISKFVFPLHQVSETKSDFVTSSSVIDLLWALLRRYNESDIPNWNGFNYLITDEADNEK